MSCFIKGLFHPLACGIIIPKGHIPYVGISLTMDLGFNWMRKYARKMGMD